jgi:hypothetical protein
MKDSLHWEPRFVSFGTLLRECKVRYYRNQSSLLSEPKFVTIGTNLWENHNTISMLWLILTTVTYSVGNYINTSEIDLVARSKWRRSYYRYLV